MNLAVRFVIAKAQYLIGQQVDPDDNLALEAYLLESVAPDTCVLYLWQNQRTIVIGRNQNAWKECRVEALTQDGGHLARRLSGGGAVFHDLGNLNFTFLVNSQDYDVDRQLAVILAAVGKLGIVAEKSGRNDVTVDGRKFSGNAFYHSGGKSYHHGTLLVQVDMANLAHYLQVDPAKLQAKGVNSVRSRVVNLQSLAPELTIGLLQEKLVEAFGEVYGLVPTALTAAELDRQRLAELRAKFASWQWKFGEKLPFSHQMQKRFPWGDLDLQLQMMGGYIAQAVVYSDAMDGEFFAQMPTMLTGCLFQGEAMVERLKPLWTVENASQLADIAQFIRTEMALL